MATSEHSELNAKHNGIGNGNGNYDPESNRMEALKQFRSAASVSMSPELFEKLYLSPMNEVKGDLRKTFGNPTPIALVGFLLAFTPLSCDLMGWRGAGGSGAASNGAYVFMGGLLMLVGGLLEWVLGNSFPAVVFCSFGGFWFSYGATLIPSFAAYASYAPAGAESAAEGLSTTGFNASFGFWLLFMGVLTTIFFVCSLRTNVAFVVIFFSLQICFYLLTAGFWALARDNVGNANLANKLIIGGGACGFVCCLSGWYILIAIMLAVVDFPVQIPVGDLSSVIKGKSDKARRD
ncbi:GPR1/FUN34/yaaH family-domain-containing protein [Ilyonectria robusta]|uniref:GPR1/FUN34/yaaH family-domain-containing protein n=1 Tax=Ilyonectria robusta TaxID=1079257 RepID=UPI001E8E8540|nr:GPR1/FUN34/yaaH family-domain-containing protein [Ilyonectria robusta]KAH6976981.1 GPR1/FUN34/yaaH family-domain-containing protein [Ilyonectria sp. MPI-CAGE-AT-0026]KAH8714184.1 GPR1/FUN34/yaaH family-domain-containing protein [Ilyonectria robusta]